MQESRPPVGAGVSFKPDHYKDLSNGQVELSFIEVHAENYMGSGGRRIAMLDRLRQYYSLSLHGVGLSIGGAAPPDPHHLQRVNAICERFQPCSFSEHLAWSTHEGAYFNDLLPLPYTAQTLGRVCDHIDLIQTTLKREILLENPATYIMFSESTWTEVDFIHQIAQRTGCGLLLDLNNVHISARNQGFSAQDYIAHFPLQKVREIHLAGHAIEQFDDEELLIDTHDRAVGEEVWDLFETVVATIGPIATLIEWDQDIPQFSTLFADAQRANTLLTHYAGTMVAS
jgi:uncharacterized protein (UPF0276 family)